jgi:hypothetical protein
VEFAAYFSFCGGGSCSLVVKLILVASLFVWLFSIKDTLNYTYINWRHAVNELKFNKGKEDVGPYKIGQSTAAKVHVARNYL